MRRKLTIVLAATALGLAGAGLALATAGEDGLPRAARDPLLQSGAKRYSAYLRAETASLRAARGSGDRLAARLHAGRVAPAAGADAERVDPLAAVDAAVRLLSLDARHAGAAGLLGVEARVAGAAVAFDAI